ncbi:sugar ABC transporter substrate-binding protein [Caenimonas sedimenti]|uniref:Sugar ABC transporter substrate-binding protein n=1 Tax=Caenimonas sedimenti TaxID=2596921 RepID=A0A562ZQP7_9BURK|nr:sugar ABC transporter substrate-binding protein [Caenimonas sedimenti]
MKFRLSAVAALACLIAPLAAGGEGLTTPVKLPAYDAARAACRAPPGLQKKLVFVQDNKREFMQGVGRGLEAAARARGISYSVALADNDPVLMVKQVGGIATDKTGAIVVAPIDPPSLAPALKKVIGAGTYVGAIVAPPATTVLNAPQYLTGKVLAEAAANYIRTRLGGKAKVVLLTHDNLQFLAPRFTAMRDTLRTLPGVTIVADISPATVDKEGGYRTMKTILLAQPNIDVVLGADTVVLGALRALREAGKARSDQFLGGIDGEQEAVVEIKKGDSPYKASISLASSIFGYAMGQQAADWLDGKSIPQAMDILPKALTSSNIADYERDTANPGPVYADPARRASYLKMYGNICFDTRENYINFPWSSETR